MLDQIVLMPLFCLEEVSEGLQFYGKRLADASLDSLKHGLENRKVGRIGVVHSRAVARAFVVPLTVQAERVDDCEIKVGQSLQGDALRPVGDPNRLGEAGGVGIHLFIRRTPLESGGALCISAHGAPNAAHSRKEVGDAPEATACEINFCHVRKASDAPRRADGARVPWWPDG